MVAKAKAKVKAAAVPVTTPMTIRIKTTAKAKAGDTEWLLPMLKEDGYWLRAHKAKHICKKLGVTFTCEAYYTDVRVWVPQLEFGVDAMPPCVSCKCATQVSVHGWSDKDGHVGRRVCGMQRHYFMHQAADGDCCCCPAQRDRHQH